LIGPVAQFLTGLFPAIFGGNMEDVKTASGYALARDQAMGRLGLVWRRTKQFYADVLLLAVDCFRKNRPEDVEIPLLGPDGVLDARSIRTADLKGNICVHPETDETFPRLKSQQRAVLQQLFGINDPVLQRALTEPANLGYIKNVLGLTEMVIPGEDSRNKQLREIQQLLASAPIVVEVPAPSSVGARHTVPDSASVGARFGASQPGVVGAQHAAPHLGTMSNPVILSEPQASEGSQPQRNRGASDDEIPWGLPAQAGFSPASDTASAQTPDVGVQHAAPLLGTVSGLKSSARGATPDLSRHSPLVTRHSLVMPSVPVDQLLDDHAVEFEECKRWANSEAGQAARMTNPAGFANVRAHAEAHLRAIAVLPNAG
jgi:hypothetical protein